jgi:hypothetical protein
MKALDQIQAYENARIALNEAKAQYNKALKTFEDASETIYKLAIQHPKLCDELIGGVVEPEKAEPKPKLISEWLQELPEPYRTQAIANFKAQGKRDMYTNSMKDAIMDGLAWKETKEHEANSHYWQYVYEHYYIGTPLPQPINL